MEQFEDRQIDDDDEHAHTDDRDHAPEHARPCSGRSTSIRGSDDSCIG
jgi:hypothetical protein